MKNTISALMIAFSLASLSGADLHLIVGSTNTNALPLYETAHVVLQNGEARVERNIVSKSTTAGNDQEGLYWIDTNQDYNVAVMFKNRGIANQTGEPDVFVLDLDTGNMSKACASTPLPVGFGPTREFLVDEPQHGLTFVVRGMDDAGNTALAALSLNPKIPCGDSRPALRPDAVLQYVTDGSAGVVATGSTNGFGIGFLGNTLRHRNGSNWIFEPESIPERFLEGFPDLQAVEYLVRNRRIEVLKLHSRQLGGRLLAHVRRTSDWHLLPTENGLAPKVRAFGEWVAWTEVADKRLAARGTKLGAVAESAGSKDWRPEQSRYGKGMRSLHANNSLLPGILHLFHAVSGRHVEFSTKQGDSEVLLVKGSDVYYRVLDRVYKAPLESAGIGPAGLIAKSELIRDAHWAFLPKD